MTTEGSHTHNPNISIISGEFIGNAGVFLFKYLLSIVDDRLPA